MSRIVYNRGLVGALAALLAVMSGSCSDPPLRSVEGNAVASRKYPAVTLGFDKGLTYAGSQEFVLRGLARIEQYFFVEEFNGVVKRLYRVQFGGYLEDNTYIYNYSRLPTLRLAGRDFHHGAEFTRVPDELPDDGSDQARADAFLLGLGYAYPREAGIQRLIWIWDEGARNELVITYMEDLAEQGLVAADFDAGGKAAGRREEAARALMERALAGMKISE